MSAENVSELDAFRLDDDLRWTVDGEALLCDGEEVAWFDDPKFAGAVARDLDRVEPTWRAVMKIRHDNEQREARIDARFAAVAESDARMALIRDEATRALDSLKAATVPPVIVEAARKLAEDRIAEANKDWQRVVDMTTRELDRTRDRERKAARRAAYWKGVVTRLKRRA